jgi:hypothetical protein
VCELLPFLGVGEHLESGVAVGGVELEIQSGIVERCGRLTTGLGGGGDHERHGSERDEAKPAMIQHGSLLRQRRPSPARQGPHLRPTKAALTLA